MAGKDKKVNQFALTEAFLRLRSNIEFSGLDSKIQVINVVSTNANEGKSTVSTNLAIAYAKKYSKVLVIDTDLRNPSVHKMLNTSNAKGLTNLLKHWSDDSSIEKSDEIQVFGLDNERYLYFLSAGQRVPNPLEILGSKRFQSVVDKAREEFDIIIIDCPPYGVVSDCIPVSMISDGTIYVVSAKETNKYAAKSAMEDLKRNGGHIIGTVLTKVEDVGGSHYGYGSYGSYYGNYYGSYGNYDTSNTKKDKKKAAAK
ncbi:MAG: CpsD/CapB family tyrosine-protein kinase [Bulleidia sp.]|nr:CpsD/CapB family tyrosine-protein kinase [Bulleidia sp.]